MSQVVVVDTTFQFTAEEWLRTAIDWIRDEESDPATTFAMEERLGVRF